MIRRATKEDTKDLITLSFLEYMEYGGSAVTGQNFNYESCLLTSNIRFDDPRIGAVFVVEEADGKVVGMIIGSYGRFPADISQHTLHEVSWYVLPEYRGHGYGFALLEALEKEAWENRAIAITIGRPEVTRSEHLDKKYLSLGYLPFQVMYFKKRKEE